jgi:hypothetical protein
MTSLFRFLLSITMLLVCQNAQASERYTYTGQHYQSPSYLCASKCRVTGYFIVNQALPPNVNDTLCAGFNCDPATHILDYSFTDGYQTISLGNQGYTVTAPTFVIRTGPTGNITSWSVDVASNILINPAQITSCDTASSDDNACPVIGSITRDTSTVSFSGNSLGLTYSPGHWRKTNQPQGAPQGFPPPTVSPYPWIIFLTQLIHF